MGVERRSRKQTEYALAEVFAQNVMRYRERRKWSMKELSRRTALDPKTLRGIRDLSYTPTLSTVQKIASALGVPPHELLKPPT